MQAKIPVLENNIKQPRKRHFSHLTYLVEEKCRAIMLAALTRSHGFFSTAPIAQLSAENVMKQQENLDYATHFGIETLQQKRL